MMATIYNYKKRKVHPLEGLPYPAEMHLTMGDCMLAAGCPLCVEVAGPDSDLPRVLDLDKARVAWALHRDAILARWYAQLDALKSPGWPCAGEVL
jgi:hypothetical protein